FFPAASVDVPSTLKERHEQFNILWITRCDNFYHGRFRLGFLDSINSCKYLLPLSRFQLLIAAAINMTGALPDSNLRPLMHPSNSFPHFTRSPAESNSMMHPMPLR